MDPFDIAKALYRDAKRLIDLTADLAAVDDIVRWTREDLDEDLLDLKIAVLEGDLGQLTELYDDVLRMMQNLVNAVRESDYPGGAAP
jgi:Na+/phosphate symporter